MPIHTFTHQGTGAEIDVILPAAKLRDELVFIRIPGTHRFVFQNDPDYSLLFHPSQLEGVNTITLNRERVPQRVNTPKIVQSDYQANRVMRGYRELEDAGKLRKSSFTPDQVKRAWAMPDNEG
jgi:hypothetical protein